MLPCRMRLPLLNLFFPPQCLICETLVPSHGTLCTECWNQVPFISAPICACCGLPLEFAVDEDSLCGDCLRERPPFSRARSAFVYHETSRSMVLKFKYQDQTYLAPIFARWLQHAAAELLPASDLILPVPLHYWRLVGRRYNQSLMLARLLAAQTGLPYLTQALVRVRHTPQQTGLTFVQRKENMRRAFEVRRKYLPEIRGKSILLVDDVMTSGATVSACTRTLLRAGAGQVNVVTLARKP